MMTSYERRGAGPVHESVGDPVSGRCCAVADSWPRAAPDRTSCQRRADG